MIRVSKRNPCPVCQKPDWCLVAEDKSAAICQRIQEGSVKQCGDAGWLHTLTDRHNGHDRHRSAARDRHVMKIGAIGKAQSADYGQLAQQYRQQITDDRLKVLSQLLSVSQESLRRLHVGWDGKAYTFGMSNDFGKIIGIRRRFPNGQKVSVKGSKTGLFVPEGLTGEGHLLICEGATDTAAALDLGFDAIGRPNCNSMVELTASYVSGRDIVIIVDNDAAGWNGAKRLTAKLVLCCPQVRIVYPSQGIKDLRQWLKAGLTPKRLTEIINKTVAIGTKIQVKLVDHKEVV